MALNVPRIRSDFPILSLKKNGKRLVYLDSAATSQKPRKVIDALAQFYETTNANVHRGVYELAVRASQEFEDARKNIARFVGASAEELVFTRNATEAINLVAYAWGRQHIKRGDVVLLTHMEHHANIVPWQLLAQEKKATLRFVPLTTHYTLDLEAYAHMLEKHPVKLVSFTHASNVLGTVTDAKAMAAEAKKHGATVLLDAAQSVPHQPVDAHALGVDFLVFSSHKMLGPLGVGGLVARKDLLASMPPFLGGGDMIKRVEWKKSEWNDVPYKFEAGTPDAAGVVGLSTAVDYLRGIGMHHVHSHESTIAEYARENLASIDGLTLYGPENARKHAGIVTFALEGVHPHDVAAVLDEEENVAVRAGHHCAMPLHSVLGVSATTRASFYVYNDESDVDVLVRGVRKARKLFA